MSLSLLVTVAFTIVHISPILSQPNQITASPTLIPSSVPTSFRPVSDNSSADSAFPVSGAAFIGAVVGIAVGGVFIVFLTFFYLRTYYKSRKPTKKKLKLPRTGGNVEDLALSYEAGYGRNGGKNKEGSNSPGRIDFNGNLSPKTREALGNYNKKVPPPGQKNNLFANSVHTTIPAVEYEGSVTSPKKHPHIPAPSLQLPSASDADPSRGAAPPGGVASPRSFLSVFAMPNVFHLPTATSSRARQSNFRFPSASEKVASGMYRDLVSLKKLTCDDITKLLKKHKYEYKYIAQFAENYIDGNVLLAVTIHEDLEALNIRFPKKLMDKFMQDLDTWKKVGVPADEFRF